ncbi:MAG: bifunctional folylpolyglutamate synthase/dihydrofolate synthase [Defluviitaleaceae bacterium]|nr:bifunctional folylpolyglutamate synthase/dihydrofolate synthase [Defluviitaleaceae bacterium]MCL2835251.1 bifunctional folylpolyglutamate synthase/dihydrofolate synthase [Defluviitaleaceae bacterium]
MTYIEAEHVVINSYIKGAKGGFDVCGDILAALGDPHKKLKVIHVTGTNGKGSTCAFLQTILTEAGYRTGMFTSPHLCRFNERFNISGADISNDDFARVTGDIVNVFRNLYGGEPFTAANRSGVNISYYELLTLMAFKYFNDQKVDIAIIEVGMGGRTDATNILDNPLLSVMTKVSLDHTDRLGSTIVTIAAEKCGIIKKNTPVALFSQTKEVYNVTKGICFIRNAPIFYPMGLTVEILSADLDGIVFNTRFPFMGDEIVVENVKLGMIGDYQAYNAANVINVVYTLNALGFNISEDVMRRGLTNTRWAGRLEIISRNPMVIVDGAHNPEGAESVKRFMQNYLKGRKIILVAGVLNDKDFRAIMRPFSEAADQIILTQPKYNVKACPPEFLFAALPDQSKSAGVIHDYREAVDTAKELAGEDGCVVVSGSLYLVGDIKMYLENRINDDLDDVTPELPEDED